MKKDQYSLKIHVFHERIAPVEGYLVGYGALIDYYELQIPLPENLALISSQNKNYYKSGWKVYRANYLPKENLKDHLIFAMKYEGLNLLFFKKLFEKISQDEITRLILSENTGKYIRKIWFLYEWLMQKKLLVPDLTIKGYELLVDKKLQYANEKSINFSRHRIKNNLPGTFNFCPLIHKTEKLEKYIKENFTEKTKLIISGIPKDIILRTSAFLLLKDSKASFNIEGESPTQNRAMRWGRAIGQAGLNQLSKEEFLRLQQIVIEKSSFIKMGYRTEGGFIGEHDRRTGEPIPEHISARWQDVELLMNGLMESSNQMEKNVFHPVLATAKIAFGFVFIHPFEDGNGRLHRYLIHHILSAMRFAPKDLIFPVSAAILARIADYRKVLESYSHPLREFIHWKKTPKNNVEVTNETIDYYRYFDATIQAEFLFECVDYTINTIIPEEVAFLQKYDAMKSWLDDHFDMPDKTVALLIRFLENNKGTFSKRAKENEFASLTIAEIKEIESRFKLYFEI